MYSVVATLEKRTNNKVLFTPRLSQGAWHKFYINTQGELGPEAGGESRVGWSWSWCGLVIICLSSSSGGRSAESLLLVGPVFLRRWSLLFQIITIKTLMDNGLHIEKESSGTQCCRVGS